MQKIIRNMSDLQKQVEIACNNAVEITAISVMNKLHDCIDKQYYKDPEFYPNVYIRTEEFLKHAAYDMLTSNKAQIYVDIEGMHYENNFSPRKIVEWALQSKHGADYYQTNTEDFWTVFIDWCNENMTNLLKNNLRKQGLKVR